MLRLALGNFERAYVKPAGLKPSRHERSETFAEKECGSHNAHVPGLLMGSSHVSRSTLFDGLLVTQFEG
jgi:hypothetical protein